MRIACTTLYDAQDPAAFQGRVYGALQAIKRRVENVDFLGPMKTPDPIKLLTRVKGKYYRGVQQKTYFPERDRLFIRNYGLQLSKRLSSLRADIVFSPMSPYSQPISYLECAQPIVIWTDATFAGVIDFYDAFQPDKLCRESLRDGIENERAALTRAAVLIYWSEWAAKSAIRKHSISPTKVRVIPSGPASNTGLENLEAAKAVIRGRPQDYCRLLFVGMDWARKGGDLVVEVAKRLNAGGLKTELSIVGCCPDFCGPKPDFVKTSGYISRDSAVGASELNNLFARSHFLFVPSRAEAFGLVFCEASSFAVPSLATDVGGIPSAVRSGINGQTFPLGTDPDKYCEYISNTFLRYSRYQELALSSFVEFKKRLNNDVGAESVLNVMAELI
jgi:glycosyltransferase involved in cell wall biosynthesis